MRIPQKPAFIVWTWILASFFLGLTGFFSGFKTVLPGPSSREIIFSNPGEVIAINKGIPPKDNLVIILSHKILKVSDKDFDQAKENLFTLLKQQKDPGNQGGNHTHF